MKVLYIGYCEEGSDWGVFARNNILALNSAGIDVACRSIRFGQRIKLPSLAPFENKDIEDCDVCIQHVFPEHMLPSGKFKTNVAIIGNEFFEVQHSTWVEKLARFDQIWVPSIVAAEAFADTIIADKVVVVPQAFDLSAYQSSHTMLDGGLETRNKFRFYTVVDDSGEGIERILKCFHSEFGDTDNAVLCIGVNETCNKELIDQKITKVKSELGLKTQPDLYRKDVFVPNVDGSFESLHIFGDCFVSCLTQRCLTSEEFHAMGFGNTPIVPKGTDVESYVNKEDSVLSVYQVNTNYNQRWADTNNGKNYTVIPCEKSIKKLMRKKYEEWNNNPVIYGVRNKQAAIENAECFSIPSIGQLMKEKLNA